MDRLSGPGPRLHGMRLLIAGGGGFRVPLIYRALASGRFSGLVTEVVLYDVDPARLKAVTAVLGSMPGGPGARLPVHATTDLAGRPAPAPTMVFAAIRPGGTAGRIADEKVAQGLGLLGQETTGAGGISYALRTIPPDAAPGPPDAGTLPGRVADQLHQPRRHGHRGAAPRAGAQGHRNLRLGRRPGAEGCQRRRCPLGGRDGSTAWATTG